jgi:hypothetical protein
VATAIDNRRDKKTLIMVLANIKGSPEEYFKL